MSFANGKVKVLVAESDEVAVRASPRGAKGESARSCLGRCPSTSLAENWILAENWMRSMGNLMTGTMNGADDRNGTLT